MTRRRVARTVTAAVALALIAMLLANALLAAVLDHPVEQDRLSAEDVSLLVEAQRLRDRHGEAVWPGFSTAQLGLVVYNDRYEFLVGGPPSAGWEPVAGDALRYARRPAVDPQAFAVRVRGTWAGSLPTHERIDRDYVRGMRSELPPVVAQLFPVWLMDIAPDLWRVTMLHEQLHAFQAASAPRRWEAARSAYAQESAYPYDDDAFVDAWAAELEALRAALEADGTEATCEPVGRFLATRTARRQAANLAPSLVSYERDLEWLEGLAKYAETRAYELAAAEPGGNDRGYRPGLPHWSGELGRLGPGLATADGDLRFYTSGMVQARLLDRLDPGGAWRGSLEDLVLEEALAAACRLPFG